ncbi:MAG: hypothetical protein ACHP6I_02240 [Rickettsiales bacterium]
MTRNIKVLKMTQTVLGVLYEHLFSLRLRAHREYTSSFLIAIVHYQSHIDLKNNMLNRTPYLTILEGLTAEDVAKLRGSNAEEITDVASRFQDKKDGSGHNILFYAAMVSNAKTFQQIDDTYPEMVNAKSTGRETVLHQAAKYHNYEVYKYLIEKHSGLIPSEDKAQRTAAYHFTYMADLELKSKFLSVTPTPASSSNSTPSASIPANFDAAINRIVSSINTALVDEYKINLGNDGLASVKTLLSSTFLSVITSNNLIITRDFEVVLCAILTAEIVDEPTPDFSHFNDRLVTFCKKWAAEHNSSNTENNYLTF